MYVIRSQSSSRLYIGHTDNLNRRVVEHNSNKSFSTKNRGPWSMIGRLLCKTRSGAMKLEAKLKRMKRPDRVIRYLENNGGLL